MANTSRIFAQGSFALGVFVLGNKDLVGKFPGLYVSGVLSRGFCPATVAINL